MIVGIGCDIVEHTKTELLGWRTDSSIQSRVFSPSELILLNNHIDIQFISGRFAVKEAIVKCLGVGIVDGVSLTEIQVLQRANGLPFVELTGEVKRISDQMRINLWHISISHTSNTSIAFVIAENRFRST